MASQELEPCLRMAIGHIRHAMIYIERVPGNRIEASLEHMECAIAGIEKHAKKRGIHLRETMKT